jgi:hypothetical protein
MTLLYRADNFQHALNDKLFGLLAVGERHVVESVYIVEIRQQLPNLLIHRQPADAGIENQHRRARCGGAVRRYSFQ